MTKEENKAIEDLKDILKYWQTIVEIEDDVEREIEMNCYSEEMPFEQLKIALNIIENSIPKDKIREKLEKIEKEKIQCYDAGQPLIYMLLKNQLKSLIEEKQ